MTQNIDNNSEPMLSCSMITIKDYFMNFVGIKRMHLAGGWGWFVDIESHDISNYTNIKINNKFPRQQSRHVYIPQTIKEIPSIRSIKSMNNLRDSSMIFEMDEDYEEKNKSGCFTNGNGKIINPICIFGLCCIFYGCIVL